MSKARCGVRELRGVMTECLWLSGRALLPPLPLTPPVTSPARAPSLVSSLFVVLLQRVNVRLRGQVGDRRWCATATTVPSHCTCASD